MANIIVSFTIADTQINRLVAALSGSYGCAPTAAAVKAAVIADWKAQVLQYETQQAQAALIPPSTISIT